MKVEDITRVLIKKNISIATMESCTGGMFASLITDNIGASNILKFSAVTYSDEYKIKMGVKSSTIDKYTVYSPEVACEMAKSISDYAKSDLGIGITGKLTTDEHTECSCDICIYDARTGKYYPKHLILETTDRHSNKLEVITGICKLFEEINILN